MVGADLLSSARLTWKPLEVLAWLAVTRGVAGDTEGAGASSRCRAKGRARATRMALLGVRAKGRVIRTARPEGKGRAIRMALQGAEDRATRMALAEGRVPKVVGVVVDSKLYPPGGVTGVGAGVAVVPGYVAVLHMFLSKLSTSPSIFACIHFTPWISRTMLLSKFSQVKTGAHLTPLLQFQRTLVSQAFALLVCLLSYDA